MNVLGYAQKIGQALMVPVAVLPAAAVPGKYLTFRKEVQEYKKENKMGNSIITSIFLFF